MSSIAQGLSIEGEASEVQEGVIATTEDFMASLGADLGLTGDESPAPEAVPAPAGEAAPVEGDSSETPPGDPDEGLTPEQIELRELRALYGRQSNELGELRKRVEQPAAPEPQQNYQVPMPVTPEVIEQIEEQLESVPGEDLALWALHNAPHLYEPVLDAWAEQSGANARKAAEFNMRYQNWVTETQEEAAWNEQQQFQTSLSATLDQEVAALAGDYGLAAGTEETDQLLADVISNAPDSIKALVVSKDAGERGDGLRVVLQLAAAQKATTSADAGAAGTALRDALETGKLAAGLGTGAQRPAAPPQEGGGEKPDFLQAFQDAILETPSTSVSQGLTFGKS